MRTPSLRSRLGPLAGSVLLTVLGGLFGVANAAPSEVVRKERIETLWLDARGDSGWVRTQPMYLDDAPAQYHFGAAFCGRGHRLGQETLRALQSALTSQQPVRIDSEPFGKPEDGPRQCITGVALFAPLP